MQKLIHQLPKSFANCKLWTANLNPVTTKDSYFSRFQVVLLKKKKNYFECICREKPSQTWSDVHTKIVLHNTFEWLNVISVTWLVSSVPSVVSPALSCSTSFFESTSATITVCSASLLLSLIFLELPYK